MTFICKKCKKAFRKDMTVYEESDEYCPHCDNHYVSLPYDSDALSHAFTLSLGHRGEDAPGCRWN
jgi:Zn finger protein HypA/HybF involved in hydrogenase expression